MSPERVHCPGLERAHLGWMRAVKGAMVLIVVGPLAHVNNGWTMRQNLSTVLY